jgi:hypothetical protein
MPRKLLLSLVVLLLLLCTFGIAQTTKRALIFAIGNYPKDSGWAKISSDADISFVQKALESQNFKDADITVVKDEDATVDGIKAALDRLIATSHKGDIVVINFSSHGEQIEDETGRKINGLEDCIVAYNAKLMDPDAHISHEQFETLKTGYLREDVFGAYVNRLRNKLGPKGDLIIFMDLCHTGVGTRGLAKVRGGMPALVSEDFGKKHVSGAPAAYDIEANGDAASMSSFEVIGAARSDELDYETKDESGQSMGSLTYAVSKVFADPNNTQGITYRTLFAEIRAVMNEKSPRQHPVLAGNGNDKQIFGGQFVPQKHFIEISKIAGMVLTLDAGVLAGLDAGTRIGVYPVNTRDTTGVKPLAAGKVTSADLYASMAHLDNPLNIMQPALACVFVTAPVYKFAPLNIRFSQINTPVRGAVKTFSETELLNMKKDLSTYPLVKFDDNKPDLIIAKGPLADSIIIASDGSTFDTLMHAGTDTALLKSKIQNYMRYVFLKDIKIPPSPGFSLDVKMVPVHNGHPDTSKVLLPDSVTSFADGDTTMLWVRNNSYKILYFNVLDLQPNGVINAVVPRHDSGVTIDGSELAVNPGVSHTFPYPLVIGPPYGNEVFKIFVSAQKIDMSFMANSTLSEARGSFGPLAALAKSSNTIGARGVDSGMSLNHTNGTIFNLLFVIKPRQ